MVVAGRNYGCGSSRDWAAKGVALLGVKAVIAESFERIHRTNLVGMGVLPLQFPPGTTAETLRLDGSETFDVTGLAARLGVRSEVACTIHRADGTSETVRLLVRLDTQEDVEYWRHGGILPRVWRSYVTGAADAAGGRARCRSWPTGTARTASCRTRCRPATCRARRRAPASDKTRLGWNDGAQIAFDRGDMVCRTMCRVGVACRGDGAPPACERGPRDPG